MTTIHAHKRIHVLKHIKNCCEKGAQHINPYSIKSQTNE